MLTTSLWRRLLALLRRGLLAATLRRGLLTTLLTALWRRRLLALLRGLLATLRSLLTTWISKSLHGTFDLPYVSCTPKADTRAWVVCRLEITESNSNLKFS